ncbi:MAG TPA: hypoxanthine phosphoribosyltransferase [Chthonomonadaceae bacterium]|nr:hypoxanthine phosphoribosyltransferase [Chthonomonadaceae bacterium]
MDDSLAEILVPARRLSARVRAIGRQVTRDFADRDLHLITVLKGGLFFLTDLARAIDRPLSIDCLAISSYSGDTRGSVRITKDLDDSIQGRHVLIVEDIIDTGLTLAYIRRNLLLRQPASLTICTLLDRPYRRIVDIEVAYVGFTVPDAFVVGYGLDWRGRYRNLPYIARLSPEAMRSSL